MEMAANNLIQFSPKAKSSNHWKKTAAQLPIIGNAGSDNFHSLENNATRALTAAGHHEKRQNLV